jgi:hypothetical protein
MDQKAEATTTDKQDQPGYGKPGRHSWKTEGLRSRRNTRRLAGVASSWEQKRAQQDRALALGEYLSPIVRARLLKAYKRELSESGKPVRSPAEPPRAQRRAELRTYARKVHVHPRLVWATYQGEKRKGLQKAA